MFIRAVARFRLLKALLASTNSLASEFSSSNNCLTEWTAASIPATWPPQSWFEPAASWMSPLRTNKIAFDSILLGTSQTPMGLTPGFCRERSGDRQAGMLMLMDVQIECRGGERLRPGHDIGHQMLHQRNNKASSMREH